MSTTEVSKAAEAGVDEVHITHHPVVAEGTGKTAQNEGAKEREVYNVCPGRIPNGLQHDDISFEINCLDLRPSCSQLSKSPTFPDGAQTPRSYTVS